MMYSGSGIIILIIIHDGSVVRLYLNRLIIEALNNIHKWHATALAQHKLNKLADNTL